MQNLILVALACLAVHLKCQDAAEYIDCGNGTFISFTSRCNGTEECHNGRDEAGCFEVNCGPDEFQCESQMKCVQEARRCDGYSDCPDGSDEAGCGQGRCPGFVCVEEDRCIQSKWLCDGEMDCNDMSDEIDCAKHICSPGQFKCEESNICIPTSWMCDNDIDCKDGSDEKYCDQRSSCGRHTFQCVEGGKCIPVNWQCDGDKDCVDGSDESDCEGSVCEKFLCRNGNCIENAWRCDNSDDCGDGSDEETCDTMCRDGQLLCTEDNRCIPITWKCDGANDCLNGSDEADCAEPKCEGFLCPENRCLPLEMRCDGRWECSDGSDETGCEKVACDRMNCSQGCRLTPNGTVCYCNPGFVLLSNNRSCSPMNDAGTNVTRGSGPLLLYATSNRGIHGIWLQSNTSFPVHYSTSPVLAVDLDLTRRVLIWSELSNNGSDVYERHLNGSNVTLSLTLPLSALEGLAVDAVTGNLYLTDRGLKRILVCRLDEWACSALLTTGIGNPGAIVLHPEEKEMFWIERKGKPSIMRAHMDGTNVAPLVNSSILAPSSLAFDDATNRLYWADSESKTIESIDLTTGTIRTVLMNQDFHPDIIAIFHDELYWSDWRNLSINSGDKFNSSGWDKVITDVGTSVTGLVVHEADGNAHNVTNPCENSPCEDICVLSGGGYKCLCRFGYELNKDDSTCKFNSSPIASANSSHVIAAVVANGTEATKTDLLPGFVIVAEGSTLYRVNLGETTDHHVKRVDMGAPVLVGAVAFDWEGQTLYFDDQLKNSVLSIHVGSADVKVVHLEHNGSISGMDFDGSNRNLYWVDESKKTLEVCRSNGSAHTVLLKELGKPIDVEVYPEEGVLFVLSLTDFPAVTRYAMDGTKPEMLWSLSSVRSMSFSVDETARLLFWADPVRNGIGWVSVRNQTYSPRMFVQPVAGVATSLSAGRGRVFWVTSTDSTLFCLDVGRGQIQSVALSARNGTVARKIVYAAPAPGNNRGVCSIPENGGCSHICLPSGLTASCICPSGMAHGSDSHLCKETQTK